MTTISITNLKMNPSLAIANAQDFPVAIQNRNDTEAYLIGKGLFERIVEFMEDIEDAKAIKNADYKNGTSLEDLEKELGLI